MSPHDNYLAGSLRFVIELVAWIAGPWAVARIAGSAWAAVPAAIILIGLPAIFSTPGDKEQVVVATAGPVRFVIELFLMAVAVWGAFTVWPTTIAWLVSAVAVGSLLAGRRRSMWLLSGAPPDG